VIRLTPVLGVFVASMVIAASALADSNGVASYKSRVDTICRANTPALKAYLARIADAQKTQNPTELGVSLGSVLVLFMTQDRQIYTVAVPRAAQPSMAPILTRLRTLDELIVTALTQARTGDGAGVSRTWATIDSVEAPLAGLYNRVGLKDCASQQNL
jgi:hypothetical protein